MSESLVVENNRLIRDLMFAKKVIKSLENITTFAIQLTQEVDGDCNPVTVQRIRTDIDTHLKTYHSLKDNITRDVEDVEPATSVVEKSLIDAMKTKMNALTARKTPTTTRKPKPCHITGLPTPITCVECQTVFTSGHEFVTHITGAKITTKSVHPLTTTKATNKYKSSAKATKRTQTKPNTIFETIDGNDIASEHSSVVPIVCIPGGYRCGHPDCDYAATTRRFIHMHYTIHQTGARPFQCGVDHCELSFRTEHILRSHQMAVHSGDSKELTGQRWIICHRDGCKYRTKSQANWVAHNRMQHTGAEQAVRFTCDVCHKSYSRQRVLDEHKKLVHTGADDRDLFACHYCFRRYKTQSALKSHVIQKHQNLLSISVDESEEVEDQLMDANDESTGSHAIDSQLDESVGLAQVSHDLSEGLDATTEQMDATIDDNSGDDQLAPGGTDETLDIPIFTTSRGFECGYPACNYSSKLRRNVNSHFTVHQT
ncbi:unnamed protein product, partial [Oppiella nova]